MHTQNTQTIDETAHAPRSLDGIGADVTRLERSVARTLHLIATACDERAAPPIRAARRNLAEVYGATRLRRRLERARLTA